MKKIIYGLLGFYRKIRGACCTFWLKRQFVSYGSHVGAARIPKVSRISKVSCGSYCSFNGLIVNGLGGGENR